jgi:Heterokaryon incompatibility protein (HET)
MHLLNVETIRLEEFFDNSIPSHTILSHTWGEDEVIFGDFDPFFGLRRKSIKIDGCCAQALKDGYQYVWIDTCSIDKSSSAELSEAINWMFAWYEKAEVCYVYLSDVLSDQFGLLDERSGFTIPRWFIRGWTLQELLVPRELVFYNTSWNLMGHVTKRRRPKQCKRGGSLDDELSDITGIPEDYIDGHNLLCLCSNQTRSRWLIE